MNKIKFSHKYYKFPAAYEKSRVAQIIVMDEKEISQPFRDYDTEFITNHISARSYYPLPKGKLILVLLIANSGLGWLWTTIRRWTPEKEKYYKSIVGEIVFCEVTEE